MLAAEAPKITDWMQAWGSLAGLVMSTAAVIFTGLLFRHEIRVRREEQRDGEAAQARLIVCGVAELDVRGDEVRGAFWYVANHSSAPIFDLKAWIVANYAATGVIFEGDEELQTLHVLEPGQTHRGRLNFLDTYSAETVGLDHVACAAEFYDGFGLQWRREGGLPPERIVEFDDKEQSLLSLTWSYLWVLSDPFKLLWGKVLAMKSAASLHMQLAVLKRAKRRR
ncbi:hypothetical protein OG598_24915 [Micromonospora sp. NBC_00330]|uniref:hypothetical protein n=1 Tax=Micromonospora sp. NBC_00330 TaxID=2903585 RepID=UPI002E2D26FF|nr:hypothetical protein [Micromonospora sp. NBC_00330]